MTPTSANAGGARFIGRVGTLAVALGIGVAVANGTAIASAETGGPGSSGTHSKATDTTKTDSSTPKKGPRKPSFSDPQKLAKRVSDVAAKVESAVGSTKIGERRSSAASTDRKSDGRESVDEVRQSVSRALTTATDAPRHRRATLDNRPSAEADTAAPLETLTVVTKTVTKDVAEQVVPKSTLRTQAPAAQPIPEMVAAVTERLTPHLPDSPVSPIHDLGMAALLSWSRRDGRPGLVPIGRVNTPEATSQVTSEVTSQVTTQTTSTLATEEQLAAERQVSQIVNTPFVQLAKVVLMAAGTSRRRRTSPLSAAPTSRTCHT